MTESQPTARAIEVSVEVPGTPEEVWAAVATGPGITSWFVPMQVDERAGGEVAMDWGSFGTQTADVVAWEPPHRVVFRGRDDGAMAFEWLVEAIDGGSCVVRLVNSGFGEGEDWDEQYDGMTQGWKIFLENLRLHRTHFPGRWARAVIPTVRIDGPSTAAWESLCGALGLPSDAAEGDAISTSGGAPELAGRVERVISLPAAKVYLLLVDRPHPGTAFVAVEGDGDSVAGSVYLYLYGDEDGGIDDSVAASWLDWMNATFAPISAEVIG